MATITPRRKKNGAIAYTAQIRLIVNGHKHTEAKTFNDPKKAERWAENRENELRRKGVASSVNNPTIGQVLAWYLDDFPPDGRTKKDHINFLINHPIASYDAVRLTPAQLIKHARARREGGAGPATVNNDFVWLAVCFRSVRLSRSAPLALQAVEDAAFILRKEKVLGRPKQRDRRPTLDELNALLEYFTDRDGRSDIPMAKIVLFGLFSARREGEITRIRRSDLNRERCGVLVREMKHPREKKDTFCHLTHESLLIIDQQPEGDVIFPYNSKTVSANFTRACTMLGIEDLHFHDLRHECTSWLFELGLDIPRVAAITGHKAWASLQRYTHLQEQGVRDKYANWPWRPR